MFFDASVTPADEAVKLGNCYSYHYNQLIYTIRTLSIFIGGMIQIILLFCLQTVHIHILFTLSDAQGASGISLC